METNLENFVNRCISQLPIKIDVDSIGYVLFPTITDKGSYRIAYRRYFEIYDEGELELICMTYSSNTVVDDAINNFKTKLDNFDWHNLDKIEYVVEPKLTFEEELRNLINSHSMENGCDTPDYILAKYLVGCLNLFNDTVNVREDWYGRMHR